MADLAPQILLALSKDDPILSTDAFPNEKFVDLKAALDKLSSRSMVEYKQLEREEAILEAEGQQIAENGSHEARVFEALSKAVDGLTIADLEKAVGDKNVTKLGQGKAFKEKWISKSKDGKLVASVSKCEHSFNRWIGQGPTR
jgi:phenylalanyl-tRNA synthetase alpha chain